MARKGKNSRKNKTFGKEAIIAQILATLSNNPRKSFNYKQVSKYLGIKEQGQKEFVNKLLSELTESGKLEQTDPGKFRIKSRAGYVIGKVDLTQHGYGFLITEELEEDVFIPRNLLHTALDGDTVKVYVYPATKRRSNCEGEVVEILERSRDSFVGIIQISQQYAFLITDNRKMPYDLFIPLNKLNGAKDGQKAIARITEWPEKVKNPFGEVIEVLGDPGQNDVEMNAILAEYDLPWKFPTEIDKFAEHISDAIPAEEIKKRRDFRKITTFTIDPHDAKDFDDALSVEFLEKGKYRIGVHIADVTHYVTPKDMIDEEGFDRATSVYLVDRVVPMLPERLSNYICSLRPDEDKLCFSAVFEMNDKAEVISEWIGRTIIRSDRRFSYEDAQSVIETGEGDLKDEILKLHELAQKLRKERFSQGSIAFDRVEVKFNLDEKGKPLGVYFKEQKESNQLVEEFMLLANKRVSEFVNRGCRFIQDSKGKSTQSGAKSKTFVYRIHDNPDPEKLESFSQFIQKFGYSVDLTPGKKMSVSINKLLDQIEGKKEQNVIENLALRAMAKARYSTNNIGHYGLAFRYYTHFTSPIRRYPDMMVHRLLAHYLEGGDSKSKSNYEMRCVHSSDMEKKAMDAERASVKYKQVEFMLDKVGQSFDAIISGIKDWGIYAEIIENKCEGMVPVQSLDDDFYEFDEDNYVLRGRKTGKQLQLGDEIKVRVKSVSLAKRQMDFELDNE